MKTINVVMVKIYITESSELLETIIGYLKQMKIRGVSVFRAISGIGETGHRTASLIDLSLNLPISIEFFEHPDKIPAILEHLSTIIKPEHIVTWEAKANL